MEGRIGILGLGGRVGASALVTTVCGFIGETGGLNKPKQTTGLHGFLTDMRRYVSFLALKNKIVICQNRIGWIQEVFR